MKKSTKTTRKAKRNAAPASKTHNRMLIVIAVLTAAVFFGTLIYYGVEKYYYTHYLIDYKEIPAAVNVIDETGRVGFNIDNATIHFGKLNPGNSGTRELMIASQQRAKVHIVVKGEMKAFMTIRENDFIIPANETMRVGFDVYIPEQATSGNYTGTVAVYFLKP